MSNFLSEQWVIGAVLLAPNGYEAVSSVGLTPESFSHPEHRAIWRAIELCAASASEIDPLTVHDAAKQRGDEVRLPYLIELVQGTYGVNSLKTHAQKVKQYELERNLQTAALEIASFAEDPQTPIGDKLDKAQTLIGAVGRRAVKSTPRSISEIALEQTAKWDDIQAGRVVPGWPTHIPSVDRALSGGLRPGSLVIVAARPGVGKSSLSQQLGLSFAKDGLPALFLSQEMPASELADRACANIGRIDYGAIQSGRMSGEDWSRASEIMEGLAQLPYSIDDQASLTLLDIRTKARMVRGLRVLFIDYLQLCVGEGDTRTAQIGGISRGLKALAKEMGICVVALSQLNRRVEERPGKRPVMADLRDSGEIEQDADVICFLWPVRELGERKIVGLEIAKNRQGRPVQVGLDFYGAYQRWAESTADISTDDAQPMKRRGGFDE